MGPTGNSYKYTQQGCSQDCSITEANVNIVSIIFVPTENLTHTSPNRRGCSIFSNKMASTGVKTTIFLSKLAVKSFFPSKLS